VRTRSRNYVGDDSDPRNEILLSGPAVELIGKDGVALPYDFEFLQPSMLKHLAGDFGVLMDDEEPLDYQRSEVSNAVKLRAIKSNAKSYEIRGQMAGFDVEVQGLYKIDGDVPADLPNDDVHILPSGTYTSVLPITLSFDDIPADVQFTYAETAETQSLLDNDLAYADESADGINFAAAYMLNVLAGFFNGYAVESDFVVVTSSADAAQSDLDAYGVPYGQNVTLTMTQGQRDLIGGISPGIFSLINIATDDEYFIEAEVNFDAGLSTWIVFTSEPDDVPTGNYHVRYKGRATVLGCSWCRSNRIVINIEATEAFSELITASLVEPARERMIQKLLQLVPAHVRVGAIVDKFEIPITLTPTVSVDQKAGTYIIAPFTAYFDDIAADDIVLDSVGPSVSVTVN